MGCIQVQSIDPSAEISSDARNHARTQKAGCPAEKNWKAQASGGRDPRRSQSASQAESSLWGWFRASIDHAAFGGY